MTWPVVDALTEKTAVLLQDRPVIGLAQGLVDALIAASRNELDVALVTPPTSRLTLPLKMALLGGHRWVVYAPGHGYLDGGGGGPLDWKDGAFVPAGTAVDGSGSGHTGDPGAHGLRPDPTGTGPQLWLSIELRHERPPAAFGLAAEAAFRALTGRPPAGWGGAEPVSQPWDPARLYRFAADRAPQPTFVTLVGDGDPPVIATLEISGDPPGTTESAILVAGYPADRQPPLDALPGIAGTLAGEHALALFFAMLRTGRPDLTFAPVARETTTPIAVVVAPVARGRTGTAEALRLPGARLVGPADRETVWFDLPGGWPSLATVARAMHTDVPVPAW